MPLKPRQLLQTPGNTPFTEVLGRRLKRSAALLTPFTEITATLDREPSHERKRSSSFAANRNPLTAEPRDNLLIRTDQLSSNAHDEPRGPHA